jgi:hypothetical protein
MIVLGVFVVILYLAYLGAMIAVGIGIGRHDE